MLAAAAKSTTFYCTSKAHIKQLLVLRKRKTSQSEINFTQFYKMHVTEIHGANTRVVNALLDSTSATTLIMSDLAKILKLKGK